MDCKNWEVGSTWFVRPAAPISAEGVDKRISGMYKDVSFLSTCRSAISLCLGCVTNAKAALVPAFTCHSVIEPFSKAGIRAIGYPVKTNLSVDWEGLISLVDKYSPQVVLIHGYFGLNTTDGGGEPINKLVDRGITVIEDLTQTMFSTYTHIFSHYKVGSIRKWMPVPDGAFLTNLRVRDLQEDTELSHAKWNAMVEKGDYIFNGKGQKECFMPHFSEAERLLDSRTEPFAMSRMTYAAIDRMDVEAFKETRRSNYSRLAARLERHPEVKLIRPRLESHEVPFLLPVYVLLGLQR